MKKLVVLLLLVLTGCTGYKEVKPIPKIDTTTEQTTTFKEQVIFSSKKKINIAVLLPLDGQYKEISENIIEAIQLAYNNNVNKSIVIRFYSTFENGTDTTISAAKEAIDGGSDIILGPLFATNLQKVAKEAARKNIPVISFSNDRTALKDTKNVYLMGYSPEVEVERVLDYVANTQHALRFVAMVPENKYGRVVLSSLKASLESRGLTLVRVVTYPPDTINFSPYVEKLVNPEELDRYKEAIKKYDSKHVNDSSHSLLDRQSYPELNLDFDTLLVGDSGKRLMLLGVHLPYVGIDPNKINFIGTRLWANAPLYNEAAFKNAAFPDFIDLQNTIFASKFSSIFKTKPTLISAVAYDAIQMISNLVTVDPDSGKVQYDFSLSSLTNHRILGVLGNYYLRNDGLTERDMEIKGVGNQDYNVIDNTSGFEFMSVKDYKNLPLEDITSTENNGSESSEDQASLLNSNED